MHEFDTDTAVQAAGSDSYAAVVSDRWSVRHRPNGGYLMAIGLRAMSMAVPHPDALSVTTHFLRTPVPGPIEIPVEVVRSGRRLSVVEANMVGEGREFARMIAAFGDLNATTGPSDQRMDPPQLPPPDESFQNLDPVPDISVFHRFDMRFHPDAVGWMKNQASGKGEISAWIRFADGREPDLLSLVQMIDALPPAVFEMGIIDPVPTVEMTAHLRAHPAPGWLRVRVSTRNLIDGMLEEEAEVWDSKDRLVAQSRQLAMLVGSW